MDRPRPQPLPAPRSKGLLLEGEQLLGELARPLPSGCDPASSEALPPEWRTCRLRDHPQAPQLPSAPPSEGNPLEPETPAPAQ